MRFVPRTSLVAVSAAAAFAIGCGGRAEGSAPPADPCALAAGATTTLASGSAYANVRAMAVDGDSVYVATGSAVVRVPRCGGEAVTLASAPASHLALDDASVYFTTSVGAHGPVAVMKVPKAGGAATTLASVQGGWPGAGGVAVDEASVYWTNAMLAPPGGQAVGQVLRMPKAGGALVVLADGQSAGGLIALSGPGVGPILPMAIDESSVYWMDTRGSLLQVPKAAGAPVVLAPALAPSKSGIQALATSGAAVYGLYFDGTVTSTPKGGGGATVVQASVPFRNGSGATGGSLAVLGGTVYWATGATRTVASLGSASQPGATVATTANAGAMAADASSVYWIATGLVPAGMGPGAAYTSGRLMRTGK